MAWTTPRCASPIPTAPIKTLETSKGPSASFCAPHSYAGQPISIWGDGGVVRDYLYVSDLMDALEGAAEAELRERALNIGSGHGTSLNELVRLMVEVVGERPVVEYLPARPL